MSLNILQNSNQPFLLWFLIGIVLFFIVREVLTWYWKQNLIVSLLREIRDLLKEQQAGKSIEGKISVIDGRKLPQPFTVRVLLIFLGGLCLVGALLFIVKQETPLAIYALIGMLVFSIPVIILDRRKYNSVSTQVPTEIPQGDS